MAEGVGWRWHEVLREKHSAWMSDLEAVSEHVVELQGHRGVRHLHMTSRQEGGGSRGGGWRGWEWESAILSLPVCPNMGLMERLEVGELESLYLSMGLWLTVGEHDSLPLYPIQRLEVEEHECLSMPFYVHFYGSSYLQCLGEERERLGGRHEQEDPHPLEHPQLLQPGLTVRPAPVQLHPLLSQARHAQQEEEGGGGVRGGGVRGEGGGG